MTDKQELIEFCSGLFRTSNLIKTDIEDVSIERVEREFVQGRGGVRVSFTVSSHLIGKTDEATQKALSALLPDD